MEMTCTSCAKEGMYRYQEKVGVEELDVLRGQYERPARSRKCMISIILGLFCKSGHFCKRTTG